MLNSGKTAVVAEPDMQGAGLARAVLETLGVRIVAMRSDGLSALSAVREQRPDVALFNLHLPPSDGVWLAKAVLAMRLPVRPAVILSHVKGYCVPAEKLLEKNGAAIIDRPLTEDRVRMALQKTDVSVRNTPETVLRALDKLLTRLGFSAHSGKKYLAKAIELAYNDARLARNLTGRLYPMVGELFGVTDAKVEQAMRYAIELAWRVGPIEEQYKIFGGTIDAQRGKPTCGETIAQLANILRLEEVQI